MMEKKFYAMVLSNDEEVIVYQGDKESVLTVQDTYDFNKYGMFLIETDKQIEIKKVHVGKDDSEDKDIESINKTNIIQNETIKILLGRIEELERRVDELEKAE